MHRTLERQVKNFLAGSGPFPQGWDAFVKAVSDTYTSFDEDRLLIERSLELSSQELTEKNQNLRASLEGAHELEEKLRAEKASVEKKVEDRTKELSKEQARLKASINSLAHGFIVTDTNDRIVHINSAFRSILRIRTTDVTIADLQEPLKDQFDFAFHIKKCFMTQQTVDSNVVLFGKQYLQIYMTPIISDEQETIGVVVLLEDVTEAKTLERSKDEFFSIASHELRTPLTAIRGNVSLIQQYHMDKLQDPELKEMIDDIHEASIRLINIVNDFLDTSRLETGRMQFKQSAFAIEPLVNDVIKEYTSIGTIKKVTLQLEEPHHPLPQVSGDKERVKQVLINLIGNALKFTEVGGITVSFEFKGDSVIIYVKDTGKGIPLENQSLLFRKFQQAGSSLYTREDVQGTGLGLYISKMMMEGMGGKIWLASSEAGKGTTFAFSLPVV